MMNFFMDVNIQTQPKVQDSEDSEQKDKTKKEEPDSDTKEDDQKADVGSVVTVRDVTEKKAAEQKIRDYVKQLEGTMKEANSPVGWTLCTPLSGLLRPVFTML